MDARLPRLAVGLLLFFLVVAPLPAAEWKTDNFVVTAPDEQLAKKVAMTAERWRVRLAKEWLGYDLPKWYRPCPIRVEVGQIGAGGETTFRFAPNPKTGRNEVYGWRMRVQGTEERILDSVIPHEVSHTIFASHFRRPLPRWADEGAATLAEHESEQRRQDLTLKQVWNSGRIPLKTLLSMTEYPSDMQDVMTLYAQGYSLADYLVQKGGRKKYLELLDKAEADGWEASLEELYGIDDISRLESIWGEWVLAGSPPLKLDMAVASAESERTPRQEEVIRSQTPDAPASSQPAESMPAAQETVSTTAVFEGFLPPTPRNAPPRTAMADPMQSDDREPRPQPLGGVGFESSASSTDIGATETGHRQSSASRSPLPRRARIDQASQSSNRDFFSSPDTSSAKADDREWGGIGFPTARTNN